MVSKRQFLSAIWLVVVLLLVGCATADPAPTSTPETISIAATRTTTFVPPTSTPLLATPTSTAILSIIPTAINSITATKVSSAEVHIVSEPSGALASMMDTDLNGQTPIIWTLLPGTYTVTVTLAGYEDWTAPVTVTLDSQMTITATLRQHYTVIPIEEVRGLFDVQWSEDGQSLIYALADEQWPAHVHLLPVYQDWWRYNIVSSSIEALPPLQSRVSNAVRESLGICPFPLPETLSYACSTTLQESPTSNRIAFSSSMSTGAADTWLANLDGSEVVYLDKILSPPIDMLWSSDSQWLLIGAYVGVDNSNLYYLVSSDGAFVESLEDITNTSQWLVQGATPQFSPNGRKVAFVGVETGGVKLTGEQLNQEDAYNLYVLDLTTLEYDMVSPRFGLFQWAHDGSGLYVLDGSANTEGHEIDYLINNKVHYADFYYIDLTQEKHPEQKLGGHIPLDLPYSGAWAYSPEINAMAGTFELNGPVFAVLFLE